MAFGFHNIHLLLITNKRLAVEVSLFFCKDSTRFLPLEAVSGHRFHIYYMYIYKTTNLINGKIYIGLSTRLVEKSTFYYGSGWYLKNAIKSYGKTNFKKEILEDCIDDEKLLCEREIYWISYYNSTDPNIGYNVRKGGELTGRGFSDHPGKDAIIKRITKAVTERWQDPEIKKSLSAKISESVKKRWQDPEYRAKQKEASDNRDYRDVSEETRAKIANTIKGTKLSESHKSSISKGLKGRPDPHVDFKWYHSPDNKEHLRYLPGTEPDGWLPGMKRR